MQVPHGETVKFLLTEPIFFRGGIIDLDDIQTVGVEYPGGKRVLIKDLPVFLFRSEDSFLGTLTRRNVLYGPYHPDRTLPGRVDDIPPVMYIRILPVQLPQPV